MSSERTPTTEPWRLRCPEGHAGIERQKNGNIWCQSCQEKYEKRLDVKTGRAVP